MILRRITLEHYGCFNSASFDFRRGLNLVFGGNESGKSLLLAALPAVILGAEHAMRLRSWGDSLSCRAILHFDADDRGIRLTRELESNLVRIEECGADGHWQESYSGRQHLEANSEENKRYYGHLQRLFGVAGRPLLSALLVSAHSSVVIDNDGKLAEGLTGTAHRTELVVDRPPATHPDPVTRQAEIAALEAELVADREEFRKGEEYLAWIRKRWERESQVAGARIASGKPVDNQAVALEQLRSELAAELRKQGLPLQLPGRLPEMFASAEELRQELATLQQELTPLLRSQQAVTLPGSLLPLLVSLVTLAIPAAALFFGSPWLIPLASGCSAVLLLTWAIFLVRLNRARGVRTGLDHEILAVETKRNAALARQAELAEQFEAAALPSAPVEMVKLQQLCRRNQGLIDRYHDVCRQLGVVAPELPASQVQSEQQHLRPEELPDAEKRLAEMGESLRRRELRLHALRDGLPDDHNVDPPPHVASPLTLQSLLPAIGQLLERMSCGRYREVRLDGERIHLEAAPGQWVPPAACSRGTGEILVLAIRLALCQTSGALLPLPIDDLPSTLDPPRRQATLRVLERLASSRQVLLTTCDEELAKRAARERWPLINLNQNQTRQVGTDKEPADAGQLHLL
jgi:hypothetical protein